MNMDGKIEELEKAVSRTVRYISRLRKEREKALSPPLSPAGSVSRPPSSDSTKKLSLENQQLREERKELRKRVRAIIKEIDKVKW